MAQPKPPESSAQSNLPHECIDFMRVASGLGMQFAVKNTFLEFDEGIGGNSCLATRSRSQPSKSSGSSRTSVSAESDVSSDSYSSVSRSENPLGDPYNDATHLVPLLRISPLSDSSDTDHTDIMAAEGEAPSCSSKLNRPNGENVDATTRTGTAATRTGPPSIELHAAGQCRPCLYYNSTKTGCLNGSACRFCHLPHATKKRPRPCKAKRAQCKQVVSFFQSAFSQDSPEFEAVSTHLSTSHPYLRSLLGKTKPSYEGSAAPSTVGLDCQLTAESLGQLDGQYGEATAAERDLFDSHPPL